MHQLKRAVVTVVATQLSHSKIQSLRQMFMAMDKNNDGSLSVAEIAHGLESAGVALPRNLHDLLENVDTDGSGVVDYTEFLAATMDKKARARAEHRLPSQRSIDAKLSSTDATLVDHILAERCPPSSVEERGQIWSESTHVWPHPGNMLARVGLAPIELAL